MEKTVKFETTDKHGLHWEKEGDFGAVAVGRKQYVNGVEVQPDVEVDFTATHPDQVAYVIATMLLIVHKTDSEIAKKALKLYKSQI